MEPTTGQSTNAPSSTLKPLQPIIAGNWPGGWAIFKRSFVDLFTNIGPWLVGALAIVPILLGILIAAATGFQNVPVNILAVILGLFGLGALIYVGLISSGAGPVYALARADGNKMTIREFYVLRWDIVWKLFVASLLFGIAVIFGLVLLIIPGIVLIILYMPAMALLPSVVAEEKLGLVESFKAAKVMADKHRGKVWGIIGWEVLVAVAFIAVIAGVVIAIINGASAAHAASNGGDKTSTTGTPTGGGGGGGGSGPLTNISFAYLYRWIKAQPTQ